MDSDMTDSFIAFRQQCEWIQTCFDTNRELFGSGRPRQQILEKTARGFFSELNRILIENYILQVCKITDPARSKAGKEMRDNLTVLNINEMLNSRGLMTADIRSHSEGLHRYREIIVEARNKSISHADKLMAMSFIELGTHTKKEAEAFLDCMHNYCDAVAAECGVTPLDFRSTSGPGDVSDLFRALNGGAYCPPC